MSILGQDSARASRSISAILQVGFKPSSKLAIALQLSLSGDDVSIKAARQYLQAPDLRVSVEASLTDDNCDEFIDLVGEVGESLLVQHAEG